MTMKFCQYITTCRSPVGMLTLASDGDHLTGLWLENQKYFGSTLAPDATEQNLPVFAQAIDWLDRYFRGEAPAVTLPLAPEGSANVFLLLASLCFQTIFNLFILYV